MRAPFLPGGKKKKEVAPMEFFAFMILFFLGLGVLGAILYYSLKN